MRLPEPTHQSTRRTKYQPQPRARNASAQPIADRHRHAASIKHTHSPGTPTQKRCESLLPEASAFTVLTAPTCPALDTLPLFALTFISLGSGHHHSPHLTTRKRTKLIFQKHPPSPFYLRQPPQLWTLSHCSHLPLFYLGQDAPPLTQVRRKPPITTALSPPCHHHLVTTISTRQWKPHVQTTENGQSKTEAIVQSQFVHEKRRKTPITMRRDAIAL